MLGKLSYLRRFNDEKLIVILLIIVFIILSFLPTFLMYFKTPVNKVYTFIHNSISDYPYYISFIRQGLEGRWNTVDQFTSEFQTPALIHVFYLWIGKIGSIVSLSPEAIYLFARIILGVVFLLSAYLFICFFFQNKKIRILSFFLFLTSSSIPVIVKNGTTFGISQYMGWWTEMDALRRVTFIPHFLMGHIGLIICSLLLLPQFKYRNPVFLFLGIIIGLITGITHPPSLGMVYYIFGISLVIDLIWLLIFVKEKKTEFRRHLFKWLHYLLFVIFTIPSLFYILQTTAKVFPWTLMKNQESLFYYISLWEYFLSIGIILPLGLLGYLFIPKELRNSDKYFGIRLLLIWIIFDFLMIPFSQKLANVALPIKIPTFANIRFLSMVIELPLAIGAGFIFNKFWKKYRGIPAKAILVLYAVITIPVIFYSFRDQTNDFPGARQFVYPRDSLVSAYIYLDKNISHDKVILAIPDESLMLPVFAGNKVFAGQAVYTLFNDYKKGQVYKFFGGKMEACEAEKFLKEGDVNYILVNTSRDKSVPVNDKSLKLIHEVIGEKGEALEKIFEYVKSGDASACKG